MAEIANASQFTSLCPGHLGPRRNHTGVQFYYSLTFMSCVINAVFSVFAVCSNSLVLSAFWKLPSLRTPSNSLLLGLAVSDLGVGLIIQPAYFVYRMADLYSWEDAIFCAAGLVTECFGICLSATSSLIFTFIAIERYLYLKYQLILTWRQFGLACFIMVLIPASYVLLRYFFHSTKWFIFGSAAVYGFIASLCVIAMVFCYFRIFMIIRKHRMRVQQNNDSQKDTRNSINLAKYKKSVTTILLILFSSLLTYLPFGIYASVLWVSKAYTSRTIAGFNFAGTVVFINSTFNPVIYCYRVREVRKFCSSIFKCSMCLRKGVQAC